MNDLLRYQLFGMYIALVLGLWIAIRSEDSNAIVNYAPLWIVAAIGVFAAFSVMYGVANLPDCPEAAAEVDKDVKEARAAMKKNGIIS